MIQTIGTIGQVTGGTNALMPNLEQRLLGVLFFLTLTHVLRAYIRVVVPPYAFLAALYLDGRMKSECKAFIFTDPSDSHFQRPDGKISLTHRRVQSRDGRIIEQGWAFKEKAIELVFDKLNLEGQQKDSDEAALVNALVSSQLSAADEGQDKTGVGQILVEIRRVTVGPSYIESGHKARFKEGQYDDVDTNGLQGEITHRTGFVRKGTLSRYEGETRRILQYRPWKSGEGLYASFSFFYRSRGKSSMLNLSQHLNLHKSFHLLVYEKILRASEMTKNAHRPTRKIRLSGFPARIEYSEEGQAVPR